MVIMVIDGLRWDFVKNTANFHGMPFTSDSIKTNKACLLRVKVNAPTVTMPRIKVKNITSYIFKMSIIFFFISIDKIKISLSQAMTTGMLPNFIDIVLNFGKSEVESDSILHQAKKQDHKLIFHGDDTWLKLFPNIFIRHDGTTSFFVSDFTEVDNNVTRHIDEELYHNDDWSIMILHYLGLDHIGHVLGPQSSLIKPKLIEMDSIVKRITRKIEEWNDNDHPSLLVVCGDHGMKNTGGHGGSTPEETLVPLIAFGTDCVTNESHSPHHDIDQIDIATTLATVLGLPIPSSNIGTVSLKMIQKFSISRKLFILYYNSKQTYSHFKKLANYKLHQTYHEYLETVKLHSTLLKESNKEKKIELSNYLLDKYYYVLQDMKNILVKSTIKYDLSIMTIAMLLVTQTLVLMINPITNGDFSKKVFIFSIIFSGIFWILLTFCLNNDNADDIFSDLIDLPIFLKVTIFTLIIVNCYLFSKISHIFKKKIVKDLNLFTMTLVIFIVSLTSSSFVEEEHQIWYFYWITFLFYTAYCHVKKLDYFLQTHINCRNLIFILKIISLAVVHRVVRKLNSMGNKYAHLPDIKTWLENQESNIFMSLMLVTGLGALIIIGFIYENRGYKNSMFHCLVGICIYLRHASTKKVAYILFFNYNSQGIYEAYAFWVTIIFFVIYHIHRISHFKINNGNLQIIFNQIVYLLIQIWVMISALLHRPHNVILLPIQIITSTVIHKSIKHDNNQVHISYWIGNIFYFYQGNSNSLATIDVAAGYVGLNSYRPIIATIFLSINTFSSRILEYLMLIFFNAINQQSLVLSKILVINQQSLVIRFLPLAFYTIFVSIQRYHLFIWTVFSPKLVYEVLHCVIFFSVVFIIQCIFSGLTTLKTLQL